MHIRKLFIFIILLSAMHSTSAMDQLAHDDKGKESAILIERAQPKESGLRQRYPQKEAGWDLEMLPLLAEDDPDSPGTSAHTQAAQPAPIIPTERANQAAPQEQIPIAQPQAHAEAGAVVTPQRANISPRIQKKIAKLQKRNLILHGVQTQRHPALTQPQQAEPVDTSAPKYLIQNLREQLAAAQQCTKELFKHIIPQANDIAQIHGALNRTYRFLIIDNIVRIIKLLKHQGARIELKQICSEFNELMQNSIDTADRLSEHRLKIVALANIPDAELHNFIETRMHDLHKLEALQLAAVTNDIVACIRCALRCGSSDDLLYICKTFNQLLDNTKDKLTPEQLKSFSGEHITPEQLIALDATQLNQLIRSRSLDPNENLTSFHQSMHKLIQPYIQNIPCRQEIYEHMSKINEHKERFAEILTPNTPYANGSTIIDRIFDQTRIIANHHEEKINSYNQTIEILQNHLNNFVKQNKETLANADQNLLREIEAFLLNMKDNLEVTHNKTAQIVDEVRALQDDIKAIYQVIGNILEKEYSILEVSPDISTVAQRPGFSGWLIMAAERFLNGATQIVCNLARPKEENIHRTELAHAQEVLEKTITRLNVLAQQLHDVAKAEYTATQNLKTLCTVLDSYENPQFHLADQDNIEASLEKDLIISNLRKLILDTLQNPPIPGLGIIAKHIIHQLYPADTHNELRNIEERTPNYPLAGQIFYGGINRVKYCFQYFYKQKVIHQNDPRKIKLQQAEEMTFDDRITSWFINTNNPQYLLYDIAARTRLNTGRLTPIIKKIVFFAEENILGGPYHEVDDAQDPEELRKYPEFKIDEHGNAMYRIDEHGTPQLNEKGQPQQIAIRKYVGLAEKQHEQPGDRFNDLMRMAPVAAPVIRHPWLILMAPSGIVRTTENILRVASQKAYQGEWLAAPPLPAALPSPEAHTSAPPAEQPLTSTSFGNLVWNAIKKSGHWSIGCTHSLLVHSLDTSNHYIQQGFNIITNPFKDSLPYRLVATAATKTTGYVQTKIHSLKVNSARKFRSVLCYFATSFVRLLESKIRQQQPISGLIDTMLTGINRYSPDEVTGIAKFLIARNADTIRTGVEQFSTLGRIDPIIPINPITRQPYVQRASIQNHQLRTTLGSFIEGYEMPALGQQT